MNYFEMYPGDYKRDTSRLGLIEHGAYQQLMLAYYGDELPLPADYAELYQIAAAVTAPDKAAVRKVADRFFPIAADGLRHNSRIDKEIAKAQKRIEIARQNGQKNKPKKNPPGMPAGMPVGPENDTHGPTQRDTRSGEAHHTPHASSNNQSSGQAPDTSKATLAGLACRAMREAGCAQGLNPSHPDLLAALDEGVTADTLADTVREAIAAGVRKPFAYAITTARGRHAEGASPVPPGTARTPRNGAPSKHLTGVAGFLGVDPHDLSPGSRVVLSADRPGTGEPVPAGPRRLSRE